jgi:hypothetical protein
VLTPELTEGPYYVADEKIRHNITEGKAGTPLLLNLTVVNASTCKPVKNAAIDIWHCDALGVYSGAIANNAFGPTPSGDLPALSVVASGGGLRSRWSTREGPITRHRVCLLGRSGFGGWGILKRARGVNAGRGNALVIHDVELGFRERRRDFVLHDFHARPVAGDDAIGLLDRADAANIDAHAGVEF